MQNKNIFADGALDRILYGELETNRKEDGTVNHYRVRGFRHESEAATQRGCSIVGNARSFPDAQGVYAAAITIFGIKRRKSRSVFFPMIWTRDDIERAIAEVYEGMRATGRGRWFKGETSGGMKLLVELDTCWCVVDAMPYLRLITPKRKQAECKLCGIAKIRVCPLGHNSNLKPRRKMPKSLRWFRRWLMWMVLPKREAE